MSKPEDTPLLGRIRGGLIVSCQAGPESPLNSPDMIAALAASAGRGGAHGFRVDRPENVAAVRKQSALPIIGINKQPRTGFDVFITPGFDAARAIVDAGADLVAIDATQRPRPEGDTVGDLIARIHRECGVPVMADIASHAEGLAAVEAGADLVATTIAGYTPYSRHEAGPALELAAALVADLPGIPVIVEGRIWTIEDIQACFAAGVHAVVVGSAITVPEFITRRFVAALPEQDREPVADAPETTEPAVDRLFGRVLQELADLRDNQRPMIEAAAGLVADAIAGGHRVAVYDTGHLVSHEFVARTGGLVALTRLEIPAGADSQTRIEAGLDSASVVSGGVLIIGSVSGTSRDTVELAMAARHRGAAVVAVTASKHSSRLEPEHPSGRRLLDVADVVLDNQAPYGDAFLTVRLLDRPLVPLSGLGAVTALWAVIASAAEKLAARGIEPSVYRSIHLPGGPADVAQIEARYAKKGH
ncbi:putative N-acetylmannosamine-6-phosphate epimerase [Kribbella kalugense]|uniref:N-acylglucosamine-6-phosphate 2-epimerase n=2 Tax=Kribbella kalugense TaxID=2512221 RepID=A0A4R8A1G5_9ACTN|nr:putative N-acetylmannosamine-6-phosphate epimerase [Kribbella kalugense]